jgi:hypothetical protein
MGRLLIATTLTLLVATALATTAAAKEMSVALASGPPSLGPGEPWNAELLIHGEPAMLKQATPGITIRNDKSGDTKTFGARSTGKRAADGQLLYRARVVFPSEGRWSYTLIDGISEREYEGGHVTIGNAESAPAGGTSRPDAAAAPADDDSLPAWPILVGGIAFLLFAAAVALALRHRPQPTA